MGPAVLYFGCRSPSEDFLYESDLRAFATDGTLNRLELAFSREGSQKVYVQHKMREQVELQSQQSSFMSIALIRDVSDASSKCVSL